MFEEILLRTILKIHEPNNPIATERINFIIPPISERIELIV